MSVLLCMCGYSCGTQSALEKHLSKNAGSSEHGPTEWTKKLTQISKRFTRFDKTGDNSLDLSELTALLRKGNKSITDAEIRMLFNAADKDGDGAISFDEFLAHIFSPSTPQEDLPMAMVSMISEAPPTSVSAQANGRMSDDIDVLLARSGSAPGRARAKPQFSNTLESFPTSPTRPCSQPKNWAPRVGICPPGVGIAAAPLRIPEEMIVHDLPISPNARLQKTIQVGIVASQPQRRISEGEISIDSPTSPEVSMDFGTGSPDSSGEIHGFMRHSSSSSLKGTRGRLISGDLERSCALSSSPRPAALAGVVRLLLIRHGMSANKRRVAGQAASPDPGLSDQGLEQAEALGKRLAADLKRIPPGDVIVASSPMKRCLLTIRPAVYRLNLAPGDCICHGSCYEFGCAGLNHRGTHIDEIGDNFPEFAPVCFNADGGWDYIGCNAKENEDEARARGVRIVNWIWEVARTLNQRPGPDREKVFVLALHQTMSDLICQLLVDGTADRWSYGEFKFKLQNAAITEIMLQTNGLGKLEKQNDYSHLRDLASTTTTPASNHASPLCRRDISERTPKLIADLRAKFSLMDVTGDHKLHFDEMAALLRRGDPNLGDKELLELFNAADYDNSGAVDFDEFIDFIFSRKGPKKRERRVSIPELDLPDFFVGC